MFRKISTKMLTILLSVSILTMFILSFVSYLNSKSIIQDQIKLNMNSELSNEVNMIEAQKKEISMLASQIAKNVQATYKNTPLDQYEEVLGKVIFDSDLAYGSGIWFEPYVYDANQEYVGPYVYKDNGKSVTTYDYSNAEYDYPKQDWYTNATKGSKDPVFSDLYYDQASKVTMTTCTAPMYDRDGTLIGVVTVDIDISSITNMINNIKIGDEGKALLLTNTGVYVTNEDQSKVMQAKITDGDNKSLVALGNKILKSKNGTGNFTLNHKKYLAYYDTVSGFNWKILIQIPKAEVDGPVNSLLLKLLGIGFIMILISVAAIITQVKYLTGNIKKVHKFAANLAEGNYTISELDIKSKDELGQMGQALNQMLNANKAIITTIVSDSKEISEVSNQLDDSTNKLATNYETVEDAIKAINENMMSTSAATEEVNASVEEVTASIIFLAQETSKSHELASSIKERASVVGKKSEEAYQKATTLAIEKENNLNQSIEEAKIVKSIGIMADDISKIAKQVTLLALNASIEAARAGEQGRGFAVVASEIGILASRTTSSVSEIQATVTKVQEAIDNLMEQSKQLLHFIKNTVTPDYQKFVEVAVQYGDDANSVDETITKITNMTHNMEHVVTEVGDAIQNITEVTQNTTTNTNTIITNMDVVSELIDLITKMVANEREISVNLDQIVSEFKL
ncbi:MAG TPA: methyl-accepting chemotaxis protein [Mobilitalea sp.]|nr:methyl-accepting chemotaxis protein [Mobilitalea sp.]